MTKVHAPFNFVPLSDTVYFPDWADQISHDMPFSDGVSGRIRLEITAKTPIFVRNGMEKIDQEKNNQDKTFSHVRGRYFIPASSIKGEVRSLLEIMSFGKMSLDRRAKFAQRDWNNTKLYPLKSAANEIHCGYLFEDEEGYAIEDHGMPYRIGQQEIDRYIGEHVMESHFRKGRGAELNQQVEEVNVLFDPKTACYKYHLLEGHRELENCTFEILDEGTRRVTYSPNGSIKGDIVLTGQPSKWETPLSHNHGKYYEFVFRSKCLETYHLQWSKEEIEHYEFIYQDSPDWKYWKKRMKKGNCKGIPVFFRIENGTIKDFGLAQLYKLPYDKTPEELKPDDHRSDKHDLAECIFGYTDEKSGDSLKGRVQFGNAFAVPGADPDKEVTLILASPKASYYPIYIEQKGDNGQVQSVRKGQRKSWVYKTYNDGNLSGWKRYHVRNRVCEPDPIDGDRLPRRRQEDGDKTSSMLIPLKEGVKFEGEIIFHNLRPVELGALLSALTFHGNAESYDHQLGQAKPYGYGRCSYAVTLHGDDLMSAEYYMGRFEQEMDKKIRGWRDSDQIKELFTLAGISVDPDTHKYMKMSNNRSENEFVNAKEHGFYLERYTKEVTPKRPDPLTERFREEEQKEQLDKILSKIEQLDPEGIEAQIKQLEEEIESACNEKYRTQLRSYRQAFIDRRDKLEEEEEERWKKERQEKKEAEDDEWYNKGLAAHLSPEKKSFGANVGTVKKWLKVIKEREAREDLNELELRSVVDVIQKLYDETEKGTREWKKNWQPDQVKRKLCKELDEEQANRIFERLNLVD